MRDTTDISGRYTYRTGRAEGRSYKTVSGELGVPSEVERHRDRRAQASISAGTGDDACHLIGDRFGASGGPENLSRGNWRANRYGSYKQLENRWADKLEGGTRIHVTVTDVSREGEARPFMRRVEWTESTPDGRVSRHSMDFANNHTAESRERGGIKPAVQGPQSGNVVHIDFRNRRRSSP